MDKNKLLPAIIDPDLTGLPSETIVDKKAKARRKLAARILFAEFPAPVITPETPSTLPTIGTDKPGEA